MNIPNPTLRRYIAAILLCLSFGCKKSNTNPANSSSPYDFTWRTTSSDPDVYNFLFASNAPAGSNLNWDFGDGTQAAYTGLSFHQYKTPGTYTVTLTVNNGMPIQKVLNVSLYLPHTFSYTGIECTDSLLSFNTNVLPDSTFLWNFGDGITSTEAAPKHVWHAPGNYTIALSINGRISKQSTITIYNNPLYTLFMAGTRFWTHSSTTLINGLGGQPTFTNESFAITPIDLLNIWFADTTLHYDPSRSTDSVLAFGYDYWNSNTTEHYIRFVYYYHFQDSIHIHNTRYVPPHWTSLDTWDTK